MVIVCGMQFYGSRGVFRNLKRRISFRIEISLQSLQPLEYQGTPPVIEPYGLECPLQIIVIVDTTVILTIRSDRPAIFVIETIGADPA